MSRESLTAVVLGAYLVAITVIGILYRRRAAESSADYWVAGRKMGTVITGLALYSALFSGAAYLGVPGLLYARGFTYFAAFGAGVTGGLLPALVLFARPLARSRCLTVPVFLTRRFPGRAMAICTPIILLLASAPYAVAQLRGGGELMEATLNVPASWGVVLTGVIVVLYVSAGGMWASIVTDVVQTVMMVGGFFLVTVAVMFTVGSPSSLFTTAQAASESFVDVVDSPLALFGIFSTWVFGVAATPWALVRFLTTIGERQARRAIVGTAGLFALFWFVWTPIIGMAALTLAPELENPNAAIFVVINGALGPILGALVVAAVFAAVMSTLDSVLLICGSSIAEDLVRGVIRPHVSERSLIWISTAAVATTGIIVVVVAVFSSGLVALIAAAAVGALASAFFAPLGLGIWWAGANTYGALSGMIGGVALYAVLFFGKFVPAFTETAISVVFSALAVVLVSLVTKQPSAAKVSDTEGGQYAGTR